MSYSLQTSHTGKVVFAGSLLLVLGLSLAAAAPVQATVTSVQGQVEAALPGTLHFMALRAGEIIVTGSTIRTGDDGHAVLVATPGTALQIDPDTVLKINELAFAKAGDEVIERKARVELKSGAVSALIDPSTPQINDFQIQTPQGAAVARGTFYAVVVLHGKTYVSVAHGKVAALADAAHD